MRHPFEQRSLTRRTFLGGMALGLGVGIPGGIFTWQQLMMSLPYRVETHSPMPVIDEGMPGPYRGRVVAVRDAKAVDATHRISREVVRNMLDRGICAFTGKEDTHEAWRSFVQPGEVVGIKVNPVGTNRNRPEVVGSITNPELLLEVVRSLRQIGIKPADIVVFERYAREFVDAGYEKLMRESELEGCRWAASAAIYSDTQTAIDGVENPKAHSPELLRHVVGYDPDHFVHMGFAAPEHPVDDDRRFRSHLSAIVTRMVDKVITLPVLKDHRSSGVTLSLKNMSHGMNNNVARSHIVPMAHGYPGSPGRGIDGPNQCNVFIPTAVNQPALRQKAVLHILDGLIGVYEGGPGVWNKSWGTWRANTLMFATDPVAMDHIGWDIIDTKRIELGLPRVGEIGRRDFSPRQQARMALTSLGSCHPWDAMIKYPASEVIRSAGDTEIFDRRTPEHVILAAMIGLGEFDLNKITYRRIELG